MTTNKMSTDMDRVGQAVAVGAAVAKAVPEQLPATSSVAVPVQDEVFEVVIEEADVPYRSLAASMHCIKNVDGDVKAVFRFMTVLVIDFVYVCPTSTGEFIEEAAPNVQLPEAGRASASAASAGWLEQAPEVAAPVPVAVARPLAPPATPPAYRAPLAGLAALPPDVPVLQQNVLQVSFERPPGGSVTLPPSASFTPSFAAPVSVPLSRTAFRHLVKRVREASHRLAELGERLTLVMQTVDEEDRWRFKISSVF